MRAVRLRMLLTLFAPFALVVFAARAQDDAVWRVAVEAEAARVLYRDVPDPALALEGKVSIAEGALRFVEPGSKATIPADARLGAQALEEPRHRLAAVIGQTMGGNPWGQLADPGLVQSALASSSHETLVHLVHEYPNASAAGVTHEAMAKMSSGQLAGMVDLAHAHIREKGPIAFGGYFLGITGFHGFHVFSGVIINIVMLIMTQKNVFQNKGHYLMIEKAGLYWHFVNLVWVFVFLCFYLI